MAARRKAMKATTFFPDPVQRRLADAVEQGDADAIVEAIRLGGDVNKPGHNRMSMLTWAVVKGSISGFRTLLSRGADVTARIPEVQATQPEPWDKTIIEFVCMEKDKSFLRAALDAGFDTRVVLQPINGETLLFRAVWEHDLEAVKILIDAGADVNQQALNGDTSLAMAESIRDYVLAVYLLSRGGDPTIKDKWGFDLAANLKDYGSRGVTPEQRPYFEEFVSELVSRGLLTRQDIVEADKPKTSGKPGVEIIYHEPGSEAGQAIRAMDRAEQEATRRGNK